VIACPPPPNSRNPAGAIAPPILKCQKSTLLNKLWESDCGSRTQICPLPRSSGEQNHSRPKAGGDRIVPHYQTATFEIAKCFMEAVLVTMTPLALFSDEKWQMVEEAWKLPINAQNRQQELAGTSVGSPSVSEVPSGPSLSINMRTWEDVSLEFCLMLLLSDLQYCLCYTIYIIRALN